MEKKVSSPKILNIVLCIIILLVFVLTIGTNTNSEVLTNNTSEVVPLSKEVGYQYKDLNIDIAEESYEQEILAVVLDFDFYIKEYDETIKFFSKLFDYNYKDIINDLHLRNLSEEEFEHTNIAYLKDKDNKLIIYPNFEYGLIEYFYQLNENNNIKRNTKYRPYNGDAIYIVNLISYFSNIYENVDKLTLLSIGAAESGNFQVKYMLNNNNIYGGMGSNGLIKHNNIEQGVLSYVRLMSRNYYGKGLNTLETIGRVYCPVYENGNKIARPHWVNLVTKLKTEYEKYIDTITINNLINIKEEV